MKTLPMKVLDGQKVAYDVFVFPDNMRDAAEIAAYLGQPPDELYKTLVVVRPVGKPLLVMVPADRQLDLKKLAKSLGEKKLQLATHREAESLTGLPVGGISALALQNRGFDVRLDESAKAHARISVSGGRRGVDLRLTVADLVRVTRARYVAAV